MLIRRLEQAVSFINRLHEAPAAARVLRGARHGAGGARPRECRRSRRVVGRVAFDDVSFSYDGKRSAVLDLSFAVQPGETVALVGSTGAGKSTALALLHRAFDPQSGGQDRRHDIRDIELAALRRNIGVVFQEPMLFDRSIARESPRRQADATDEEMREALARAGDRLHRAARPGLDTVIGERGRSLSGGERQRLSIARALLKDPPILILDEATSALDAATERKLPARSTR